MPQCSAKAVVENLLSVIVVVLATIAWVWHSKFFYDNYAQHKFSWSRKRLLSEALHLPSFLLCNRMPFNLEKMEGVSAATLRYAEAMLNASRWQDAGFQSLSKSEFDSADKWLSTMYKTSDIDQNTMALTEKFLNCHEIVSHCELNGTEIDVVRCCKDVNATLTPFGVCYPFGNNNSFIQNTVHPKQGLTIRLTIDRKTFESDSVKEHAGFDLYFRGDEKDNESAIDPLSIAIGYDALKGPISVEMKKGTRVKLIKREIIYGDRACHPSSRHRTAKKRPTFARCLFSNMQRHCHCSPLFLTHSAPDNTSLPFCSLSPQIDSCISPYLHYLTVDTMLDPVPSSLSSLEQCQHQSTPFCRYISYDQSIVDHYQLTAAENVDAELRLFFGSLLVTRDERQQEPSMFSLLSVIGFSGALWFVAGHLVWSVARLFKSLCCRGKDPLHQVHPLLQPDKHSLTGQRQNVLPSSIDVYRQTQTDD